MDNNDDAYLRQGFLAVLKQLFDAAFGRTESTKEEMGEKVHLLGTLRRRLGEN